MQQQMHRMEIITEVDSHPFVPCTKAKHRQCDFWVRIVSGRSFLTGYPDVVPFDGRLDIEIKKLCRNGNAACEGDCLGTLIDEIYSQQISSRVVWDNQAGMLSLGLFVNTEMPVQESAKKVISKLAELVGASKKALMQQNQWTEVVY